MDFLKLVLKDFEDCAKLEVSTLFCLHIPNHHIPISSQQRDIVIILNEPNGHRIIIQYSWSQKDSVLVLSTLRVYTNV